MRMRKEVRTEDVVQVIRNAILEVVGEEWADEMSIETDSNLGSGMELDSIELSKVIEIVFRTYPGVAFDTWFAGMGIERIMSLTVGDIAQFVADAHAGGEVAEAADADIR